ncbi:MAG: type IV pilin N-terminal domain-containing protein, partial [Euryarchaeota archaeon]|nr:type IV pilin N-terminal domain-containing protein [Euryarchaeota archaeon]
MKKRTETFTKDCEAISEIIGELMMITIAVVAFGVLAAVVLSYKGPVDSPHADIDGWVNAGTDTVYFRHGGGELIEVKDLRIMLNLNGTSVELSPADLTLIYGKPGWGLGDTIKINTSDEWGITIGEDDYVGATSV